VRGLVARTKFKRIKTVGLYYEMSRSDPTTWLANVSAALVFVAVVPFGPISWFTLIFVAVAAAIVQVNWTVGSHWVIALSESSEDFSNIGNSRDHFNIDGHAHLSHSFYFTIKRNQELPASGIGFGKLGMLMMNCIGTRHCGDSQ